MYIFVCLYIHVYIPLLTDTTIYINYKIKIVITQ